MNNLFVMFGIESWKPIVGALLLPPVPWLLLLLVGARQMLPRRGLGWLIILFSGAMIWLSACTGTAQLLSQFVLHPPGPIGMERIKELKAGAGREPTAIIVLGGGMKPYAPEYGVADLSHWSLERLRYGVWLGRETGLPVGFSGGLGWGQPESKPEAQIAAQIAQQDYGRPLKWIEDESRDTRENAARTIALLKPQGIKHIVLVTHGMHMPRARRAFEEAAGTEIQIEPAAMGLARNTELPTLSWLPTTSGFTDVRYILHELFGRWGGA